MNKTNKTETELVASMKHTNPAKQSAARRTAMYEPHKMPRADISPGFDSDQPTMGKTHQHRNKVGEEGKPSSKATQPSSTATAKSQSKAKSKSKSTSKSKSKKRNEIKPTKRVSPTVQVPTMNVGLIGHVAHGKSTFVKAISGITTGQHKEELKKNLTIKLGYANAKLYRGTVASTDVQEPPTLEDVSDYSDSDPDCNSDSELVNDVANVDDEEDDSDDDAIDIEFSHQQPQPQWFYDSRGSCAPHTIKSEQGTMTCVRQVSFVDCPGHEVLMTTMLNGASVMDAAVLVVAANERFPQPQTLEHLAAMEIMQLKNVIVVQNKVDLVKPHKAQEQYLQIQSSLRGTVAEGAPIIPVSAHSKANIDMCIREICRIPMPPRNVVDHARMLIVRSFCVNKPKTGIDKLVGGVLGGSLVCGQLKKGQLVELRPGLVVEEDGVQICKPLITRIESLFSDKDKLETASPGGLIGIGTCLDPSLSRGDQLIGQTVGPIGTLPPIYNRLEVSVVLLRSYLGETVAPAPTEDTMRNYSALGKKKNKKNNKYGVANETEVKDKRSERDSKERIQRLSKGETLQIHSGAAKTQAIVLKTNKDMAKFRLKIPFCLSVGERITISRMGAATKAWRLIGWGEVQAGREATIEHPIIPQ